MLRYFKRSMTAIFVDLVKNAKRNNPYPKRFSRKRKVSCALYHGETKTN